MAEPETMPAAGIPKAEFLAPPAPSGPPDPGKLTIVTPGIENQNGLTQGLSGRFPHTNIVTIKGEDFEAEVMAAIRTQLAKNHGTLKEIVIEAHGSPSEMTADGKTHPDSDPRMLNPEHLLASIAALQQETGQKVTDRLVFGVGCNVFTNLTPDYVQNYRETAQKLQTEIVGSVELGAGGNAQSGMIYQFAPDGSVKKDPALFVGDTPEFKQWLAEQHKDPKNPKPFEQVWADCNDGQSQQKGAACQNADYALQWKLDKVFSPIFDWEQHHTHPASLSDTEYKTLVRLKDNIENSGARTAYGMNEARTLERFLETHPKEAQLLFSSPQGVQEYIQDLRASVDTLKKALPSSGHETPQDDTPRALPTPGVQGQTLSHSK